MSARAARAAGTLRLAASVLAHGRSILPDGPKLPLAGKVPMLLKTLLTLGSLVLALRNNASVLVHEEIVLLEPGGPVRLVRGSMPHLGARSTQELVLLPVDVVHTICGFLVPLHRYEIAREKNV